MKTKMKILATLAIIGGFLPLSSISAQDDVYYMPSKSPAKIAENKILKDTTKMTDYERYRALKDAENPGSSYASASDTTPSRENSSKRKSMDNSNHQDPNQTYTDGTNDQNSNNQGTTIVNNNYYTDDYDNRFEGYRSLYFDYCYNPFYSGYGWGYPHYGWGFGWSPYYYDPYGYFYNPYWYYPSYYGYWGGGNGYYGGHYNSYYGHRNAGYANGGTRRSASYAANSSRNFAYTNMATRRSASTIDASYSNNRASVNATSRRGATGNSNVQYSSAQRRSLGTTTYSRANSIATTRPQNESYGNHRTGGTYTPSYSLPRSTSRATYNSASNSGGYSAPRRSSQSYSTPARSSNSGGNTVNSSRSASHSSSGSGSSSYSGGGSSRSSGGSGSSGGGGGHRR